MLLNKIHPFYEGNGKTGKIVFANDDMANDDMIRQKFMDKFKLYIKKCYRIVRNVEKEKKVK